MFNVPNKSKLQHPWNLTFAMVVVMEGWGGRTVRFQMIFVLGALSSLTAINTCLDAIEEFKGGDVAFN